jgi:hypothetical protein
MPGRLPSSSDTSSCKCNIEIRTRSDHTNIFQSLMQILVVVPGLETKSMTVTFKLNDHQGKDVPDTKLPSHTATASGGADIGAARRRTPEAEEPRQTAEDLV